MGESTHSSTIWSFLLPKNRYHNGAPSRTDIAFQVDDLLPCAQHGFTVGHGHRERWPHKRGLQVRMAIAIVPGQFVAVVAARRDQAVVCS